MSEQEPSTGRAEAAPDSRPEREIVFRDRPMWVRPPNEGQLVVWKRTLNQLQNADTASWTGAEALAALERSRKIVDSVLVHKADANWIDEKLLDDEISLRDTVEIINLTVEAFADETEGNREQRRAAAKKGGKVRRGKVQA